MNVHFRKNRFQRKCERGLFFFERRAALDERRDKFCVLGWQAVKGECHSQASEHSGSGLIWKPRSQERKNGPREKMEAPVFHGFMASKFKSGHYQHSAVKKLMPRGYRIFVAFSSGCGSSIDSSSGRILTVKMLIARASEVYRQIE